MITPAIATFPSWKLLKIVTMPANILVVEDEPAIQELIAVNLEHAGHHAIRAKDAESALDVVKSALPDLLLIDWMLPGMSGVALARQLRQEERTRQIPIILLTARSAESDKIAGLEAGADDYVTKPFSPREVVARVRAVLRRAGGTAPQPATVPADPAISADPLTRRAKVHGKALELTRVEFDLLACLLESPGRVFTRAELIDRVWGDGRVVESNTLDAFIMSLRHKLEAGGRPRLVQTIRGVGYAIRIEAES